MRSLLRPPASDLATALLDQLGARRLDPHRQLRGHDFFPPILEVAAIPSIIEARTTPPAERLLRVHYFTAYCDWFVAGFDPRTGIAYGYIDEPGPELHDWAHFDLTVLCRTVIACEPPVVVWRDQEWRPQPARTVIEPDRLAG